MVERLPVLYMCPLFLMSAQQLSNHSRQIEERPSNPNQARQLNPVSIRENYNYHVLLSDFLLELVKIYLLLHYLFLEVSVLTLFVEAVVNLAI